MILLAIDWDRRKAEDAEIAAAIIQLQKSAVGYQHDAGSSYTFASMINVPLFNCADGKVRSASTAALVRNELCLHESQTLRGTVLGGKEDVTPLNSNSIPDAAKLIAAFVGGPASVILGAIGGSPGSKPLDQLTIAELLQAVGVKK